MTTKLLDEGAPKQRFFDTISILLALMPIFAFFVPRFLGIGPSLIGIGGILALLLAFRSSFVHLNWPKEAIIWAALFPLLAAVSSLWAVDTDFALERAMKIALITLPGVCLLALAGFLPAARLRALRVWLPLGTLFLACGIVFELLLDTPIYRATHDMSNVKGNVFYVVNRASIALLLLLCPVFLMIGAECKKTALCLIALLAVIFTFTYSQSMQLAALVMAVSFIFPFHRARWPWLGLQGLLIGVIFSSPWLAISLFDFVSLFEESSIFEGAAAPQRLEIYDYVARYTLENPIYGFGIEASRHINDFDSAEVYQEGRSILHPHNFALQLWLEFGVMGAVLGSIFCVRMLELIRTLFQGDEARYVVAIFLGWISVASTGYGMWQGWWLGLSFLIMALIVLSIQIRRQRLNQD